MTSNLTSAVIACAIALGACGESGESGGAGGLPDGSLQLLDLPGGGRVVDLSPDGARALYLTTGSYVGFLDVATQTATLLETSRTYPDYLLWPVAMTDAGQIAGNLTYGNRPRASIFDPSTGWVPLPDPDAPPCYDAPPRTQFLDMNPSGDVVGSFGLGPGASVFCPRRAYLWQRDGTGVELQPLGGENAVEYATDVSADGSTIGGVVGEKAAIWRPDGSGFLLGMPGFVRAISGDGSVVLGSEGLWTQAGVTELPVPEGGLGFSASSITENGAVVFGNCVREEGELQVDETFVWTEKHGHRRLADLAAEVGVVIPEGNTLTIGPISADGSVLACWLLTLDLNDPNLTHKYQACLLMLPPAIYWM